MTCGYVHWAPLVYRCKSMAGQWGREFQEVGLAIPMSCHVPWHSFATNLIAEIYDIWAIQRLPGHRGMSTTMMYTNMPNRGREGGYSSIYHF